jgi:prepilin-type N-terminal cleavage/methylation domain-containing protein
MLRRDEGFTLVELVVVVAVVGILMTIGLASYSAMTRIADDKGTQLDLLTATKVQALHHLEEGVFTDDRRVLFDLEPVLRYSPDGEPAGTVVVSIAPGRAALDVCLFARTPHGEWFAIHHSVTGGDRYAESTPVACTPGETAGWSAESW